MALSLPVAPVRGRRRHGRTERAVLQAWVAGQPLDDRAAPAEPRAHGWTSRPPAADRRRAGHGRGRAGGRRFARLLGLRRGAGVRAAGLGRGGAAGGGAGAGADGMRGLPGLPAQCLAPRRAGRGGRDVGGGDLRGAAGCDDPGGERSGRAALGDDGAGAAGGGGAGLGPALSRRGVGAADHRRGRGGRADERHGHAGRRAAGGVLARAERARGRGARQHEPVLRHPDRGGDGGLRLAWADRAGQRLVSRWRRGRPMAPGCGPGRRCSGAPARRCSASPASASSWRRRCWACRCGTALTGR